MKNVPGISSGAAKPRLEFAIRVVVTIASLAASAGGPSRSVTALCSALAEVGVSVTLLTLGTSPEVGSAVVLPDRQVFTRILSPLSLCGAQFKWSPHLGRQLREVLNSNEDVIVHDNGLWLPFNHTVFAVAHQRSVPLVSGPRGMLEPWSFKHKGWKKRVAWWLYQRRGIAAAKVIHATSVQEADGLRALGLTNPIAVIPNGVEVPVLQCFGGSVVQSEGEISRSESTEPPKYRNTEVPKHRNTALFLSRIHPKKGLLNLISAWAAVRPATWRLIICGPDEGRHAEVVRSAVEANGLAGQIELRPAIYGVEKESLMMSADLFVLPTFSENFGIAIAEALAAGVPVITTKGTPWEELLAHRCGWWVDIGVESLVAALREAMALSDGERREMGARGRRLVEEQYSWPRIAREMMSVYEWILGKGPVPGCVVFK